MEWNELVDKAINTDGMDYETNKNKTYIFSYNMLFNKDGEIYAQYENGSIACNIKLAERKTPEQMWSVMQLLKG